MADLIEQCWWMVRVDWTDSYLRKEMRKTVPREARKSVKAMRLLPLGQANLYALAVLCYFGKRMDRACEVLGVAPEDTALTLVRLALARWEHASYEVADGALVVGYDAFAAIFGSEDGSAMYRDVARFVTSTWGGTSFDVTIFAINTIVAQSMSLVSLGEQQSPQWD